jgi:hypothetical protein
MRDVELTAASSNVFMNTLLMRNNQTGISRHHHRTVSRLGALALVCAAIGAPARSSALVPIRADTGAAAVLVKWFDHIQRNEYDSLPQLLARGFEFRGTTETFDATSFVSMIAGLGIDHPRVTLSEVQTAPKGGGATVTYRRSESFEVRGTTRTVVERGTCEMVREGGRWRILRWETRPDT